MAGSSRWYKFPLEIFDFGIPYHRWLFSLARFGNDAQLFAHLWATYPTQSAREPRALLLAEYKSLLYHAIAHTYEALKLFFDPPNEIGPRVRREVDAVSQSIQAKQDRDVRALEREIRQAWRAGYQQKFERIRNSMVAHYGNPHQGAPDESYWTILSGTFEAGKPKAPMDGTIIVQGSEDVDGRYRHVFVDMIQERFVDSVFPPGFWTDDGEAQEVAEFLDKVTQMVNELVVPLIVRLACEDVVEEYEWHLNEEWHRTD